MKEPKTLCLAGPTAVGKSAVAIELALHLDAEVISVDSMQVYRGMNIGTAKPAAADLARVRHHLIDVIELSQSFDAAQFAQLASQALSDIHKRGRTAILCGGTGLYYNALLAGLGQSPPPDPVIRAQLENTTMAELLSELRRRDPDTYERIDRQNSRRVVRALEVIRITGVPFSKLRAHWQSAAPSSQQPNFFGLSSTVEDLRRRIDARVDWMFANGLVAETETLLARGLAENKTARHALGYRQVIEHLEGARSLDQTIDLVKLRTRQYAKRQLTWFRRQTSLTWFSTEPGEAPGMLAGRIAERHLQLARDNPSQPLQPINLGLYSK
jgi:tRNA dimethylallyltransferase